MKSVFRKNFLLLAALLVMSLPAFAMGGSETEKDGLMIVTSFYPMYDFTVKLAGSDAEVVNLVPSGTEPHDWEPSTRDIITLERADVFIYSGAGMEHWVDDVLASLGRDDLIVVEASAGISLLEGDDDHGHSHGGVDPHVWLDVENAIAEMANIRDGLILADGGNAALYNSRFEEWKSRLEALDTKFEEELALYRGRSIVVSHEAFAYLCNAYGLNQVGISGIEPDSEPDPARMAYIEDYVKENKVSTIFTAELVNSKVSESIARESGAAVVFLSPYEGLTDAQAAAGGDYISVMEENLASLVSSFEKEAAL